MFERLSDSARRVLTLANQEAMRRGQEIIGTEHILLGLMRTRSCTGKAVLEGLEADLKVVEVEVAKRSETNLGMHQSSSTNVIERAIQEAQALNHNYVGTEHILLGLITEQKGLGGSILRALGLDASKVREEILTVLNKAGEEQ